MTDLSNNREKNAGILYGALCYGIWGFLTLYWKLLNMVPALELLANRIAWSLVFVAAVLLLTGKKELFINTVKNKKTLALMALCSVLICINWFVYIWAVNANHIKETSMGYYINPLVSVLFGVIILKERMNIYQKAAMLLAFIGVAFLVVEYGKVPWISLILAFSFACYGLVKKILNIDPTVGLTLETAIMAPFAAGYIIFRQASGVGALGNIGVPLTIVLLLAGIATAVPLLLFAKGTNKVDLTVMGFLQYISPTISLALGVFVFHEPFTHTDLISFGFIWAALVVFSLQSIIVRRTEEAI